MRIEEIEAEALKLEPRERASLAGKLLHSLESLSNEECEELWAAEALRRNEDLDRRPESGRDLDEVLSSARAKLS